MPSRKAVAPTPSPAPEPLALDRFYNLRTAAIRLALTDPDDPEDTTGQRWLREGFNRPLDGSKGRPFPGRYMGRAIVFSESDLAVIDEIACEETRAKQKAREQPPVSTGRRRTRKSLALTSS